MFYTNMEDFHSISFIPELTFGKPKRDFLPALHNDAPMTGCVSGFEDASETFVGGFHFIFFVDSHENGKGFQIAARGVPQF